MDKEQVQHIFFDLDNTLWDHRGNSEITLAQMFRDYHITEKHHISFDEWHPVFYEKNELLWEQLRERHITKEQLRERRFKAPFAYFKVFDIALANEFETVYLDKMGDMTGTVEGANELLEFLKPNYHIHVITNGFEEVSQNKLNNTGLNKWVETLTCADELGIRKPDPRIFTLAMQKANAQKENCLIVGDDWIADVIGGIGFGWQAIFFDALHDGNEIENVPNVKKLMEIKDLL